MCVSRVGRNLVPGVDPIGFGAGFIGSKIVNKDREGIVLDIVAMLAVVGGWPFKHLRGGLRHGPEFL